MSPQTGNFYGRSLATNRYKFHDWRVTMSQSTGRKNAHDYKARLVWDGNLGTGTTTYTGYGRKYRLQIDGKPDILGSADPIFRAHANAYNPEHPFVAALS